MNPLASRLFRSSATDLLKQQLLHGLHLLVDGVMTQL